MAATRSRRTRVRIYNEMDLGSMQIADRWALYFRWANAIINRLKRNMQQLHNRFEAANTAYEETRMMVDVQHLKGVKVIGMTTSGAARLRKLLLALAPRIVIVEEAAEVLEQHIVTSLTRDCKHLILIGDHQQLRPSAAHVKLARHFNMEVSLFERMISNGVHSRRLGVQHRMRPELAALISPHIYPDLLNHPSVEHFPSVRGMTTDLFFMTHSYKEEEVDDSSSKSNQLEADMVLKLANYLMQQGYEPEDITVLTAYSGQMFYMRKQRDKYAFLSKVKITVVDNYQGEESKIILLSLVRNNDNNKIGFLGTENRVCVALSRAREGFYIFGNIEILKQNSELWQKIAITLESNASLGTSLMLKCESHPEQISTISSPKEFEKVPEGGCLLKCGLNLPCGHACPLVCHGYDRGHNNIKCYTNCERIICELDHVCPLLCWKECEPCKRLIDKVLPCGHTKKIYCHRDPADPIVKCTTTVTATLPGCGHEVEKACCVDINHVKCPEPCIYRVAKCGHECRLKCHVNDDPDHEKYLCDKPCANAKKGCTANLIGDRGDHQCPKKCHETCDDCNVEVKKKRLNCKHWERVACCKDVNATPCPKKCARMLPCSHHCKKKCHEPCGECKEMVPKIIPECNHKVKISCMTEPTRALCREKCQRTLPCGHVCTQRCDQPCDIKKCTQIVGISFASPCGHMVKLPCNMHQDMVNEWNPELLLVHCTEPCGQQLACEHFCGGSCGACHQGRLHAPCKQKCQRDNICGHQCNEPCNQVCPPCNKPCEIRCPHSRCRKTCGAPCVPCQEPCRRACRHGACKNRCGEPCSRPACDEVCELKLPCGHRCRGLCGEPCPDICRLCSPDTFPVTFLGDEFEDDVKFVQLQDCKHVLDVDDMDNLMTGDRETISIRPCPFCRTPIINTYRYKDLVNEMFRTEINPIKKKVYGNEKTIRERKQQLKLKLAEFEEVNGDVIESNQPYKSAYLELHRIVINQNKVYLLKIDMQLQYLEILNMIAEGIKKYKTSNLTELKEEFKDLTSLLCTALKKNVNKISQQIQIDIGNELKRMNSVVQLAKILSHPSYRASKTKLQETTKTATETVFTRFIFDQNAAVLALKNIETEVKINGIVLKEERDLIVKAIGLKAGSWYKCPNGHFYCIGECGGAMQVSKCVDCGAAIGGQNHALLRDNAHAGDMDGSRFAAWSNEYNDMRNFEL